MFRQIFNCVTVKLKNINASVAFYWIKETFCYQDTPEQDVTTERVRCTSEDVNDPEPISSGSTLPNLDGADDSSSDDGKGGQRSAGRRRSRTYKPLAFRFRQRTAPSKTDPAIASTSTARHPDEDRKTAPPHVEISEIDVKVAN